MIEITGVNKIVIEVLHKELNRLSDEVRTTQRAIHKVTQDYGKRLLGEQEGPGQFILRQDQPNGPIYIVWVKQEVQNVVQE